MVKSSNRPPDDQEPENSIDSNIQFPLDNDVQGNNENVESNDMEGAVGYSAPSPQVNHLDDEDVNNRRDHDDLQTDSYYRRRHSSAEMYQYNRPQRTYRHSESTQFRSHDRSQTDEVARHNHLDIPNDVPAETAVIGLELYIDFLREEIRRRDLQEPECLMSQFARSPSYRNQNINNTGDTLRRMANAFASTPLRHKVQQKAESVSLQNLDFQSFQDLLYGLFQEGGVTSERVVVLFFFCSDLVIRALCESVTERFLAITQWSQWYIVQKLSVWVQQHGGWGVVLQHSVNQTYRLAVIGLCCLATAAMLIYIRRNLK